MQAVVQVSISRHSAGFHGHDHSGIVSRVRIHYPSSFGTHNFLAFQRFLPPMFSPASVSSSFRLLKMRGIARDRQANATNSKKKTS